MKKALIAGCFMLSLSAFAEESMPLFYNIAPFSPGKEDIVAADMKEYVARTKNRKVLYSLTLHPEGLPAMAKVGKTIESYRCLKDKLKGSDVELGILLQSIMGHWPRTDKTIEPWQRTVDSEGNVVRFCWLDERYRNYIRTVARMLAAEKPCFILGDDDIRAFSPHAECFCPLHVAEFNRRRGTSYTSAQMSTAVKSSVPGSPDFETFMALQREQVNGVASLIREGIDQIDPLIPAGTCMPIWESRFYDQTARAIAAKGQRTVMRICNGNYQESRKGSPWFGEIVQRTQSLYAYHHDKVDAIISEADTFPHHLWSRSATSWHAHLAMTLFSGLKGAKLWFVNAHKSDGCAVNRNYTDRLAENAGFYRTLLREMSVSESIGLMEPCLTTFRAWHPVKNTNEGFVCANTWAAKVLSRMGVPSTVCRDYKRNGIWTLAGEQIISRLSDDEIKAILAHCVLIDGMAAVALTKRGFMELIGVKASAERLLFNGELCISDGLKCQLNISDNVPKLELLDGARRLTSLVYYPYSGAAEHETVAPGVSLFENRFGGTVAVTAFHSGASVYRMCNEARQEWLFRILDSLAGERMVPCVANRQDVMVLGARTHSGDLLLAVFNLNYDPMQTIDLRVRGAPNVSILGCDGVWRKADIVSGDGILRVRHEVPCYGVVVLRMCGTMNFQGDK